MSVTEPNKLCKNSFHWRNNSDELDVFAATRYFSAAAENPIHNDSPMYSPKINRKASTMSLDLPTMQNIPIGSKNLPTIQTIQKLQLKESKKCKQPNSPGGRLANFLNSLFNQTDSKKKKLKSKERRSSISHFRINSEVIAPPPPPAEAKTPTKSSYKGFSEQPATEFRFSNGSFRDSAAVNWIAEEEDWGFRKFSDVDDGADSDSSSDLFDLPNCDLDLPVYGTTDMGRVQVGAPISSV